MSLLACFSDDSGDPSASPTPSPSPSATPTPLDPVLKDDGSPANFSCNGSFADPASTNVITAPFHALEQTISGTPASANTQVVTYDAATGTTNGAFSGITNASGDVSIGGLDELERYTWKLSRAGGQHVDTYTYGVLATSGTTILRVIQNTVANVFVGLLVSPVPADLQATTHLIAGAIEDCDGDAIQNAFVEVPGAGGTGVALRCGEDDSVFPCIAYFAGSTPSTSALDTDASGQFAVIGAPPDVSFVVKVMGVTSAGQPAVQIGQVTTRGKAGAISLATTHPLPE